MGGCVLIIVVEWDVSNLMPGPKFLQETRRGCGCSPITLSLSTGMPTYFPTGGPIKNGHRLAVSHLVMAQLPAEHSHMHLIRDYLCKVDSPSHYSICIQAPVSASIANPRCFLLMAS